MNKTTPQLYVKSANLENKIEDTISTQENVSAQSSVPITPATAVADDVASDNIQS